MSGQPSDTTSPLGPTEHAVLEVLVLHAGRVVSRQNLVGWRVSVICRHDAATPQSLA